MKTHVLTFAKQFMKGHPREGEPTNFKSKIIDTFRHDRPAKKIHTIRSNYEYWAPKIDEVNAERAILSIRNWTGKPYRSKQHEFLSLAKAGYQKVRITELGCIYVNDEMLIRHEVAQNDGLSHNDFHAWFAGKLPFEGIIIHFTEFRY